MDGEHKGAIALDMIVAKLAMRPSPLYPWLIAAVTAVFTAAVVWAVDYHRDTDARREREHVRQERELYLATRERLLAAFEQPCDPETTTFEGQPVAVWLDRIRTGSDLDRIEARLYLPSFCEGKDRFGPLPSRWVRDWTKEAVWDLVAEGHRSRRAAVVVPPLVAALEDPSASARQAAADVLHRIGPLAIDAVYSLRRSLGHPDGGTRVRAASALFAITRQPDEALATLAHALANDPDPWNRSEAAACIGYQLNDRRGLAALTGALADPDDDVRQHVSDAWKMLTRDRE